MTLDVKLKKLQFYDSTRSAATMTVSLAVIKWALLLLYVFDLVVGIPISGFSEVIANLVIGIFFVSFLRGKSKWYENVLFCVVLLFIFYQAFFSGFGYAILYLTIYLLSIFFIVGKFNDRLLNALLVVLGIMTLFLMNLISSNKVFLRTENSLSALEKINYLIQSTDNSREEIDDIKNTTFWRASYQASALSFVMENTPSKIPYWDGASYVNVVLKFIPRFLWPNKPKENMGQRFGHTYGITRTSDTQTSMNTPILAESYMNYSYFGFFLLVIILIFTLVNVFFQINIRGNSMSDSIGFVDQICLAQFGLYFTQWESNFSMMLGKIVILFFIRWTLIKLPYFFMRLG